MEIYVRNSNLLQLYKESDRYKIEKTNNMKYIASMSVNFILAIIDTVQIEFSRTKVPTFQGNKIDNNVQFKGKIGMKNNA